MRPRPDATRASGRGEEGARSKGPSVAVGGAGGESAEGSALASRRSAPAREHLSLPTWERLLRSSSYAPCTRRGEHRRHRLERRAGPPPAAPSRGAARGVEGLEPAGATIEYSERSTRDVAFRARDGRGGGYHARAGGATAATTSTPASFAALKVSRRRRRVVAGGGRRREQRGVCAGATAAMLPRNERRQREAAARRRRRRSRTGKPPKRRRGALACSSTGVRAAASSSRCRRRAPARTTSAARRFFGPPMRLNLNDIEDDRRPPQYARARRPRTPLKGPRGAPGQWWHL